MAKTEYLSELDFDTQYRKAQPDFFYSGLVYYHKVKYPEGYVAEEAGIHQDAAFDEAQFKQDAYAGLAYLPVEEMPEQEAPFTFTTEEGITVNRTVPEDGIMKEGQLIEGKTEGKPGKPLKQPKKSAKKGERKEVAKVKKTAEIPSQELVQEKQQEANGEATVSPIAGNHD